MSYDNGAAEKKYFDETVDRIESSFKVGIPIEVSDHGLLQPVCITVDEFFVHECYIGLERLYMKLEPQSLDQVIAHEIAHLKYWRHGKNHTKFVKELLRSIDANNKIRE